MRITNASSKRNAFSQRQLFKPVSHSVSIIIYAFFHPRIQARLKIERRFRHDIILPRKTSPFLEKKQPVELIEESEQHDTLRELHDLRTVRRAHRLPQLVKLLSDLSAVVQSLHAVDFAILSPRLSQQRHLHSSSTALPRPDLLQAKCDTERCRRSFLPFRVLESIRIRITYAKVRHDQLA